MLRGVDDLFHHRNEQFLILGAEMLDGTVVCALDLGIKPMQKCAVFIRQCRNAYAAVSVEDGPLNEAATAQTLEQIGHVGFVDRDGMSQICLIDRTDLAERRNDGIHDRRDIFIAALFGEERRVDLVQTPDQVSRSLRQRRQDGWLLGIGKRLRSGFAGGAR